MSVKLIALDLDGTLLESNHMRVSKENISAIQTASKNGAKIVISTGRPFSLINDIATSLNVVDYIISSNGARIQNSKLEDIYSDAISPNDWSPIYDFLIEKNVIFDIYIKGNGYIDDNFKDRYFSLRPFNEYHENLMKIHKFMFDIKERFSNNDVEKINIFSKDLEEKKGVMQSILKKEVFSIADGLDTNFEITKLGVSKGKALSHLCKTLNIDSENVMAFGDGDNDCEMLEFAGYSIAMGNGIDKVKKIAKYTTDTSENHGVAKGIEKYMIDRPLT